MGNVIYPHPFYLQQSNLLLEMSSSIAVEGHTLVPLVGFWHERHRKKLDWRTLKSFLVRMARGIEDRIDDLISWWGRLRTAASRENYLARVSERSFDAALRHLNTHGFLLPDIPVDEYSTPSTSSSSSSSSGSFTSLHEPVGVGRAASAFSPWPN